MNFNNKNMFFISKHHGLINTVDSERNLNCLRYFHELSLIPKLSEI